MWMLARRWSVAIVLMGSLAAEANASPLERALATLSESKISQAEALSSELSYAERAWVQTYAEQRMRRVLTALDGAAIDRDVARVYKTATPAQRACIRITLSLILMGDIAGALREYARKTDKDMRQFTRLIVKKLEQVSIARARVIRNFARNKPPRAYGGGDPQAASRAQDRAARYTQFVQTSTRLMNELQNTERELMDALQSMHRDLASFWQSYASFRNQAFRTNERVMTIR